MCQYWLKSFASKQQKCFHDALALPSKYFFLCSKSAKFIATSWCWLLVGSLSPFSDLHMTEEYIWNWESLLFQDARGLAFMLFSISGNKSTEHFFRHVSLWQHQGVMLSFELVLWLCCSVLDQQVLKHLPSPVPDLQK